MPSKSRNRERRAARRQFSKPPRRRLIVACEGTTEQEYIEQLAKYIGNPSIQPVFCRERGTPDRIIQLAQNECRSQNANLKDGFDEIWCVFDRDDHDHFNGPIQTAIDRGYSLAVSNPCIELWLWLHHRPSPGAQTHTRMQEMLKDRLDAEYDKHIREDFYFASDRLRRAVAAAFQLDKRAREDGEPQFSNPSTSMYKLVLSAASKDDAEGFVEGWEWLARYQ